MLDAGMDQPRMPLRNPTSRDVLRNLLDAGAAFAPEYGGGLSSHLPMALSALHSLGASDDRLRAFHARYSTQLAHRRRMSAGAPAIDPWLSGLGQYACFDALLQYALAAIRRDGRAHTLRQFLPRLMPGVAAAAFHGLIRTAHGVAADHDGEVAAGLAYWASRHLPPGQMEPAHKGSLEIPDWLARLRALRSACRYSDPSISARMERWFAVPGFAAAAESLYLTEQTLPTLARRAAEFYAASGDFIALHLVTGCHALQLLRPYLDGAPDAMRSFTNAIAAALLASTVLDSPPGEAPLHESERLDWAGICAQAILSPDEHVIKLVHACRDLGEHFDDAVFKRAAARALI